MRLLLTAVALLIFTTIAASVLIDGWDLYRLFGTSGLLLQVTAAPLILGALAAFWWLLGQLATTVDGSRRRRAPSKRA